MQDAQLTCGVHWPQPRSAPQLARGLGALASPHAASAPCHANICLIVMNCLQAAHHTQRQAGGKPVVPLHTAWFGGSHQAAPHATAASFPAVRVYTSTRAFCVHAHQRALRSVRRAISICEARPEPRVPRRARSLLLLL